MNKFFVINYDINRKKMVTYDIFPYLVRQYRKLDKDLHTFEEFRNFIKLESQYQWWSRTEYEIILKSWPCGDVEEKWDIYDQIMMNLDIITNIFMNEITGVSN